MCGIAGLIYKKEISQEKIDSFISSSDLLGHRGPDYKGVLKEDSFLFIHHRLSIIDLDERSNQPFVSNSGKSTTIYNGEIYNFRDLIKKYQVQCRTTSDTEVMLETFEKLGTKALPDWNGIFAAAIFDGEKKEIHLIRDRLGIKPLYIYEDDDVVAFASEAKVILKWLPSFSINPLGLAQYMWYGNTTGEETIVKGLLKVKPGSHLTYNVKGQLVKNERFWSIENDIKEQKITEEEAVDQLKVKLEEAVKRQLVADVPIGVLLSGGIDSSSIVAYASKHISGKLDTYSVEYDFNYGGNSELERARLISEKFGTSHHEFKIDSTDVKDVFSDLVFQYDEPFADAANIPLYKLAKACSRDKKVILQGDGGDELFGGYRRYNVLDSYHFWKWTTKLYPIIPNNRWKERFERLYFVLSQKDDADMMAYYLTQDVPYKDPFQVFNKDWRATLRKENWKKDYQKASQTFRNQNRVQKLLYTDATVLLPHTYLEKVDKATMNCSVEARVPFLDNDLVSFALSLPSRLKVRKGQKKYLLKKALKGLIPEEILFGPKRGFDVPYKEWLKKDLYVFAKDSFRNFKNPVIDEAQCIKLLDIHKEGTADYGTLLWKTLVLNHWFKIYNNKIRW